MNLLCHLIAKNANFQPINFNAHFKCFVDCFGVDSLHQFWSLYSQLAACCCVFAQGTFVGRACTLILCHTFGLHSQSFEAVDCFFVSHFAFSKMSSLAGTSTLRILTMPFLEPLASHTELEVKFHQSMRYLHCHRVV